LIYGENNLSSHCIQFASNSDIVDQNIPNCDNWSMLYIKQLVVHIVKLTVEDFDILSTFSDQFSSLSEFTTSMQTLSQKMNR
jgi:hypothetical protein